MSPHRCPGLVLGLVLSACTLADPSAEPDPDYGTISARVRGEPWVSVITTDSIVAWYNDSTGHFRLAGSRTEPSGNATELEIVRCGPLTTGQFGFARVDNGPYGYAALSRGAIGTWTEPMRVASPQVGEPYPFREIASIGLPGDALVIESLDLDEAVVRGRFQFHATSPLGYVRLLITGRFAGRIFPSFQPCMLP